MPEVICNECGKEIIGLTQKQAEQYLLMHYFSKHKEKKKELLDKLMRKKDGV